MVLEIIGFFLNLIVLILILAQTQIPFKFCRESAFMARFRSHVRTRFYTLKYSYSEKHDHEFYKETTLSRTEDKLQTSVRIIDETNK